MSPFSPYDTFFHFDNDRSTPKRFVEKNRDNKNSYIQAILKFIEEWQSKENFILQKTSGSTGTPKTIEIAKSRIVASSLATINYLDLKAGDNALLCINPEYIGGKMMIARALIGGLNLSITSLSGNPLQDYSEKERIDFFSFVPYQLEKIIEESPEKIKFLDSSKAIILGGAAVSVGLAEKIKASFSNTKVYSTYGMTETVSHVALKRINSDKNEVFKAIKDVEFSIDDRNCLVIHAPEISGQDELITNDVVDLISSTEFLWLGRIDFVINSGGIKIHPEVLEREIAKVFDETEIGNRFFVFGRPDEKLGESVNLLIEGQTENTVTLDLLKEKLKAFHAPKKIYFIDKFRETESGKINRLKSIEGLINS